MELSPFWLEESMITMVAKRSLRGFHSVVWTPILRTRLQDRLVIIIESGTMQTAVIESMVSFLISLLSLG